MIKSRILRATSVAVTSVGLVAGLTGIAGASSASGSLVTTGPHSLNKIRNNVSSQVNLKNDNKVDLSTQNWQQAYSGNAKVTDNTHGGNATTGAATNTSSVAATVNLTNNNSHNLIGDGSSKASATIRDTGPFSTNTVDNKVRNTVNVTNTNDIRVSTDNQQTATSGNATVSDNTHGGNATTGAATNTSSTSLTLNVTNNN